MLKTKNNKKSGSVSDQNNVNFIETDDYCHGYYGHTDINKINDKISSNNIPADKSIKTNKSEKSKKSFTKIIIDIVKKNINIILIIIIAILLGLIFYLTKVSGSHTKMHDLKKENLEMKERLFKSSAYMKQMNNKIRDYKYDRDKYKSQIYDQHKYTQYDKPNHEIIPDDDNNIMKQQPIDTYHKINSSNLSKETYNVEKNNNKFDNIQDVNKDNNLKTEAMSLRDKLLHKN